jgi:hypothetical protein
MAFLKRFSCFSAHNVRIEPTPDPELDPTTELPQTKPINPIKGAGVIFTNGTHILAGYQPNKKKPFISGIGGRIMNAETNNQAAIREMIEELFDIYKPPPQLIDNINRKIPEKHSIINGDYAIIVYTFEDLDKILKITEDFVKKSPIYKKFPENLNDLLWNRLPKRRSEISHLCILPFVEHNTEPFVDSNLLEDLKLIKSLKTI